MPRFCAACGGQMADNASACPACGKAAGQSAGGGAAAAPAQSGGGLPDNVTALLCYSPVALLGWILVLAVEPYKNNKFLRFHCFQSIFLCIGLTAVFIALSIFGGILGHIIGPLALIIVPIDMLLWLGSVVLFIFMMIKAYGMQKTKLPFIGDFAEKTAG
jgi:uncharacterized membrane protein